MKCSEVERFLFEISTPTQVSSVAQIPQTDLDYLSAGGYIQVMTKEDYSKGVDDVSKLSQLVAQLSAEREDVVKADVGLQRDQKREHSILFRFEGDEKKRELLQRIQEEAASVSKETAEVDAVEASVNLLIQQKSTMDRMVRYDGGYICATGLGTLIMTDLAVRDYRVSDTEFPDFVSEIKAVYAELRAIADRATVFTSELRGKVRELNIYEYQNDDDSQPTVPSKSLPWSTAIGLAKLQGDTREIWARFSQAYDLLEKLDSSVPHRLMGAEIIAAAGNMDVGALGSAFADIDSELRGQGVPKEVSPGVAATMIAGRRYDGSYPVDRFTQFRKLTQSYEAASIMAVMNVPYDSLTSKFQGFRDTLSSWGYMKSEDTEISSAFLAIGELGVDEVHEKLRFIVEQLRNYLEYPLVAAAILASIPVFETHEALDLMEKAVTLLAGYAKELERSESVALAVRMIHGIRNELVRQVDSTAKIAPTPVQFTYPVHPGMFGWYHPVIIAHASYHSAFSGMGAFHPAHSHGVGGFAG